MSRKWIVQIEPRMTSPSSYELSLGLTDPATGQPVKVSAGCGSLDEFQKEITSIKGELDELLKEAEEAVRKHEQDSGKGGAARDPKSCWQEMEQLPSEQAMFDYFNALNATDRAVVAEYVLTHVNMFRGRGPIFAERYDSSSHRLE